MADRIAEKIRGAGLSHAGVDNLERVLDELGIDLNAEQKVGLRDAVGPSCDRQFEKELEEIIYPTSASRSLGGMDGIRAFLDEEQKRNQ